VDNKKGKRRLGRGAMIGGRQISNLRYADDITLMAKTVEEMANLLQCIERISGEVGLKLNRSKCCLLKGDRAGVYPENPMYITDIQMKSEVIYLGARISNKNDSMGESKQRISTAKAVMMKLTKFWKDQNISEVTEIRLIHTSVLPVVMYGSETWTLNANSRKRIEAFEVFCWGRMLRIPWVARRKNDSILEELRIQTRERLLSKVQRGIIKFLGHIVRQDGLEKLVIQGKVDGKRKRGRSLNRFIDQVAGLTGLSIYNLVRQAEDREAWRVTANRDTNGPRRSSMDND
jgi:hypothetical protein